MAPEDTFTSALARELAADVLERFCRYVKIDTQSRRDASGSPSTPGQLELARLLVSELEEAGLEDVQLDENGYVTATLPRNVEHSTPVIGLVAQVTSLTVAFGGLAGLLVVVVCWSRAATR